ncbi:unnamed protein product [Meloidogyne enterolobii]|uniref:Uncharacterized protein n=1 Tax=Meloidogyne enterolobii TaxID=390850 RepID=A0ACB0Y228_MELEN
MDHFRVDMAQCPRCGRQREQGRIRVQASPCHKLIGCERCLREYPCELGDEDTAIQMQAFWQCPSLKKPKIVGVKQFFIKQILDNKTNLP